MEAGVRIFGLGNTNIANARTEAVEAVTGEAMERYGAAPGSFLAAGAGG